MMAGAGDSKSSARAAAACRRRDRRRAAPPHLQHLQVQDRGADGHGAVARMRLPRNRREAQMRSDIAALLHEKREDTARIRVSTQHQHFQFIYLQITRKVSKRQHGVLCRRREGPTKSVRKRKHEMLD